MKFLRKSISFVWAFAALFVAQLFVPLALAVTLPERGGLGIIICTSTGLKQFTPNGDLVPVGDSDNSQPGQSECLVCLTAGLTDSANVPQATAVHTPRLSYDKQTFLAGQQAIPAGQANHGFNARAPPVRA